MVLAASGKRQGKAGAPGLPQTRCGCISSAPSALTMRLACPPSPRYRRPKPRQRSGRPCRPLIQRRWSSWRSSGKRSGCSWLLRPADLSECGVERQWCARLSEVMLLLFIYTSGLRIQFDEPQLCRFFKMPSVQPARRSVRCRPAAAAPPGRRSLLLGAAHAQPLAHRCQAVRQLGAGLPHLTHNAHLQPGEGRRVRGR